MDKISGRLFINATIGKNGIITKAKQVKELADYLSSNIGNEGVEDFLNNGDGHAQVSYHGYNFLVNLEDYTFTYLGKSNGEVNILYMELTNSKNIV